MEAQVFKNGAGEEFGHMTPNPEKGIVMLDYQGFVGDEDAQSSLMQFNDLLVNHPGTFYGYIVNMRDLSGPFGDNTWLKTVWTPMAIKAGILASAGVVGDELFSKMSLEDLVEGKIGNFRRKIFDSEDAAMEWMENLKP